MSKKKYPSNHNQWAKHLRKDGKNFANSSTRLIMKVDKREINEDEKDHKTFKSSDRNKKIYKIQSRFKSQKAYAQWGFKGLSFFKYSKDRLEDPNSFALWTDLKFNKYSSIKAAQEFIKNELKRYREEIWTRNKTISYEDAKEFRIINTLTNELYSLQGDKIEENEIKQSTN